MWICDITDKSKNVPGGKFYEQNLSNLNDRWAGLHEGIHFLLKLSIQITTDIYEMIVHFTHAWASYQIRKFADCACAGNAGNVFPASAGWRSRHASRHVRDVRAVMSASLTSGFFEVSGGKNFPAFTAHAQPAILRIWQESHYKDR